MVLKEKSKLKVFGGWSLELSVELGNIEDLETWPLGVVGRQLR